MTIKLELFEIIWLQNIKRQPSEYHLFHAEETLTELCRFGLIELKPESEKYYEGLHITNLGIGILNRHLPLSSVSFRDPIPHPAKSYSKYFKS